MFRLLLVAVVSSMLTTAILQAANWPSTSGTTARGYVIEDGTGVGPLGTAAHPMILQ